MAEEQARGAYRAGLTPAADGAAQTGGAEFAQAPWWRRGVLNGLIFGALALGAALALNYGELPGLGRILAELPAAVGLSAAVHIPQILLTAAAWRALLPPAERPDLGTMGLLRWYRESANALLPAGAIIGQAAAARLLARRGVPGDRAGATATVDLTLEAVSQLFFTLAGVALLLVGADAAGLLGFAAAGLFIAAGGAGAMILVQRRLPLALLERGLARLARRWPALRPDWVRDLQQAILRLHADWPRLAAATLWHGAAWVIGALEIKGVLWLLGVEVSLADALVIESLAQALRNVGFMLPGALAVQEGAIIGAAALVGVAAAPALAVALVRRTREVCLSLPGLLAWQRAENTSLQIATDNRR
ncbi:lysylphosphatidylglycerol synthase domain-containing protein [Sabulicella rubraurantiaca]|uniref:lysylphosphatidylglycerol synthase domain-containing protein n=1 Tax=Sabulicella rubraurantiaca TaxID=2811429 RepID=UPI001A9709F1|nr:lysylphosphatidylglycerol synthase domain-containing protein [Sabulicella rubraurantiaca]